jgi:hypothetical protein
VAYEFRTKSAESSGLEKDGQREPTLGFRLTVAILRFGRECPPLLGFYAASQADGEDLAGKHWRSECDWDPTVSEFVARILLRRVRLGSNRRTENTGEIALMVCDLSVAKRFQVRVSRL